MISDSLWVIDDYKKEKTNIKNKKTIYGRCIWIRYDRFSLADYGLVDILHASTGRLYTIGNIWCIDC